MTFFDGGHLILTMVFERNSFFTYITFEVHLHTQVEVRERKAIFRLRLVCSWVSLDFNVGITS
jgi:hypothetical protein